MQKLLGSMPIAFAVLLASGVAHAGETTRVASAFEKDNPIDLHASITYDFRFKRAAILREWGRGNSNRLAKDLIYKQQRHTLTPTLELGLFRGLAVYVSLPIVVSDDRTYGFDNDLGDSCVYPREVASSAVNAREATCVDKTNSSSIRDGIIPRDGYDGTHTGDPFGQTEFLGNGIGLDTIFRAPNRRGVDQLHVGLKYAILDQNKRSYAPTWVLGLEGRFGVGQAMTMSRKPNQDPAGNHAVGRRIHELGAWMALSRKHRFFEPFFGGYWRFGTKANDSQFVKFSTDAQKRFLPQSHAGAQLGIEIVPWVIPEKNLRFSINVSGSAEYHYGGATGGRGYSEIWELLADSPALVGVDRPGSQKCNVDAAVSHATNNRSDPSGYLKAANAADDSGDCVSHSGITTIQDYGTFGLELQASFHLGRFTRLQIGSRVRTDTRHFLSASSRGEPSLVPPNDTVEPGTKDVNPNRRDVIDNAGRRYAIDDVVDAHAYVQIMMTF